MERNDDEHRSIIDDETEGFWAEKRARQERCRELMRSGLRTQVSMFLIAPELVKQMKFIRRTDEF